MFWIGGWVYNLLGDCKVSSVSFMVILSVQKAQNLYPGSQSHMAPG